MLAAGTMKLTLVWVLTGLTCLLTWMAIGEGHRQIIDQRSWVSTSLDGVIAATATPTRHADAPATPAVADDAMDTRARVVLAVEAPVKLAHGTAYLRLERLTLSPGASLPFSVSPDPIVFFVEAGTLTILSDGAIAVGHGLDAALIRDTVSSGQRIVVSAGTRLSIRNEGKTPAAVLVVAIDPNP